MGAKLLKSLPFRTRDEGLWYNAGPMVEPRVVPRNEHTLSRKDVDPDALTVLYRLHQASHIAYLVGGSVRDLLLGRRPKDFDIGTSAHPNQVKRLFRNCWIIGRRFRLAHVKFGMKVIEVATFRRQVQPDEIVTDQQPSATRDQATPATPSRDPAQMFHDNTFGTPEEDAFRRDFTINALFYDIGTFAVIDYVNGLEDLRAGVVRSIGDPEVRFLEDPVRMLRAVALSARLDFAIDPPILEAIKLHRREIARSSPPRLLEEYYKILRSGYAQKTFQALANVGLLEPVSEELHLGAGDTLWKSLAHVDEYRARFGAIPEAFTNPILLGSLLVPLGLMSPPWHADIDPPRLGALPLARRDVERIRQVMGLQRRLRDLGAPPRVQSSLAHRHVFQDALNWLEIHGESPQLVDHWKAVHSERGAAPESTSAGAPEGGHPFRRRRRRRRRGRHHGPPH
jgi:poly(A) polymerase